MSIVAPRTPRLGVPALALCILVATAGCSSGAVAGSGPSQVDRNVPAAGGILRAYIGGAAFDLRVQRMSRRSDAGGARSRCVDATGPVQFDVNWAAANGRTSAPKVTVGITTADGTVLTLGASPDGCRPARHATFDAMPAGTQLVLNAALPRFEAK